MGIRTGILAFVVILSTNYFNASGKILTLQEAESTAIKTGYESRAKYFEEQAKEWEKRNVIAGYLPTVNYNLNFLRLGDKTINKSNEVFNGFGLTFADIEVLKDQHPGVLFPSDMVSPETDDEYANPMIQYKNSIKHEFSVNQPITNGGAEIIAITIAKHTTRAIGYQVKSLQQESIYATRKAYFDVIAARERTKVAKQDLSWSKQNLHKANVKYETGSIPVTDVLQWEAEVSRKESDVLEAEATEQFMLYTLYQTIGIAPEKVPEAGLQPFESFEKWYEQGMKATEASIAGNYDLLALKEFTIVSEKSKDIALTSFLPKVNGFISATLEQVFNDAGGISDINMEKKPPSFAVGAVISVPLFSGFRNSTSYRKSSYEYKKAVVNQQKVETQMKVNLRRVKLFYRASYEGVKAAKKQQELMKKQLEIMQKRYNGGLVNQSQLLEVALGASQTRIGYIQKLFECLLYEAEYLKNVGKLEVTQ